jgi:hypothetical protein
VLRQPWRRGTPQGGGLVPRIHGTRTTRPSPWRAPRFLLGAGTAFGCEGVEDTACGLVAATLLAEMAGQGDGGADVALARKVSEDPQRFVVGGDGFRHAA